MKTTGLTDNDVKLLEMDLIELKNYRNRIQEELSEVESCLAAVMKDREIILPETNDTLNTYFAKWKPEGLDSPWQTR